MRRKTRPQLPKDVILIIWTYCNFLTKCKLSIISKCIAKDTGVIKFMEGSKPYLYKDPFTLLNKYQIKNILYHGDIFVPKIKKLFLRIITRESTADYCYYSYVKAGPNIYANKIMIESTNLYIKRSYRYPNLIPVAERLSPGILIAYMIKMRLDFDFNDKLLINRLKKLHLSYYHVYNYIYIVIAKNYYIDFNLDKFIKYLMLKLDI